jgi:hypothetical protein
LGSNTLCRAGVVPGLSSRICGPASAPQRPPLLDFLVNIGLGAIEGI